MYKVSVVVPIYKCEKYIERCVKSLMEQTLDNIQYIFVDDCSPDDSINKLEKILENYPKRKNDVLIISNDVNLGPSATRNKGMRYAQGDYIAFCDSDDFIELNMYEILYNNAIGFDIVFCDINIIESYHHSYQYKVYLDCYKDKESFIKSVITSKWNPVCNCLINRDLIKEYSLVLPEHIRYCEDFYFIVKLAFFARNIKKVNQALYNYSQENYASIMHNLSFGSGKDDLVSYLEIIDFLTKEYCIEKYEKEMSWRVLNSFHFDMFKPEMHKDILIVYPTCHKYILSNPFYIKRQKQIMWMLTHHCRWGVLLFIYLRKFLGRKDIL